MFKSFITQPSRLLLVGLVLSFLVSLLVAPTTLAKVHLYGGDSGGGGGGEGDPLDGNDYSDPGMGGIGDDIENSFGLIEGGGGLVFSLPGTDKSQVWIIMDFQGKIPVLRVLQISSSATRVEGTHAR
jgi:hypothetical protein|nr:hypothetical protein [Candidatus Krumholzibacteria bacterium]